MGIPYEIKSMQASMVVLETFAKRHSLMITDDPDMVEAVAYPFSGESVP